MYVPLNEYFDEAMKTMPEPYYSGDGVYPNTNGVLFMHGTQDGQKFTGIILLCVFTLQGTGVAVSVFTILMWPMIVSLLVMAAGTAMGEEDNKVCGNGHALSDREINYDFGTNDFWLWFVLGSLILVGPFIYFHKLCTAMNLLCKDYNEHQMIKK